MRAQGAKRAGLAGLSTAVYLRKSRMEEGLETAELLSRHQKALGDYAKEKGLCIRETYHEVVSGESLYARPEMLRLLEQVGQEVYDAVLVMDLDRLSRGRMKDQGIILDTFRDSGTLIITPEKTYDLHDEIDDELAEFKTFLSRREYKLINKRLQRGLQQSIRDGYYVANPPYGYERKLLDKRPSLAIVEAEADFVRMMFRMYLEGYGCTSIARQVNLLGARPRRSDRFSRNSVAAILRNQTYTGKVVWDQKRHIKKGAKGKETHITVRNPREAWTIVDGLHPPIIDPGDYSRVQEIMTGRAGPAKKDGRVKNPFAGLLRCGNCGRNMQRMTLKGEAYLLCVERGCCAAAKFSYVEELLLSHLRERLAQIQLTRNPAAAPDLGGAEHTLKGVRRELSAAEGQKLRLYELLELGEYDLLLFRARMAAVEEKCAALEALAEELLAQIQRTQARAAGLRAQCASVLDAYEAADAAGRNELLRCVIAEGIYRKEKGSKPREFQLELFLKPF